jgi:hypothetical protein
MNIAPPNPVTDDEITAIVSAQARADLVRSIMTAESGSPARMRPRRLLVTGPVAAVLATAAVIAAAVGLSRPETAHPARPAASQSGQGSAQVSLGPHATRLAALSFRRHGHYLIVVVRNPDADPARYRREFAAHGLNVDLRMQPVAPAQVGQAIFLEDDGDGGVQIISVRRGCHEACQYNGVLIPLHYKAFVRIIFGKARP